VTIWSTAAGWGPDAPDTIGGATAKHFTTTFAPNRLSGRYGMSVSLASALFRSAASFDLIHVHMLFPASSAVAGLASVLAGVPFVLTLHGNLDPLMPGGSQRIKAAYLNTVGRYLVRHARAVHVVSAVERANLSRFFPDACAVEIGWGVTISDYSQDDPVALRSCGVEPDRFLLFVGRLHESKGVDRLFLAYCDSASARTMPLVIAGQDDGEERRLRLLAQSLGIESNVRFLGSVSHRQKVALLRGARAFVMPAYTEMFGLAIVEALAAGAAVVVTDQVALAGELRESGSALVADPTVPGIGAAIGRLVEDTDYAAKLGRSGHRYAQHHLSWDSRRPAFDALYRAALAEPRQ
jgi:glycosyltransferase involved in cell wall biosynthesis